jgi:hypothetical protein
LWYGAPGVTRTRGTQIRNEISSTYTTDQYRTRHTITQEKGTRFCMLVSFFLAYFLALW